jgi:hypothetical protein
MASRTSVIPLIFCSALACNTRERTNVGEEEFVTNEVRELKAALAARDETKVLVGCMSVTTSALSRMPKAKAEEIERLCYVDAPKLFLENAVRDATDAKAKHPELSCMQLMAGDAFKAIAKHPTDDAALQKLVDEYTRLCPEQVAKFRARNP